MVPLTEAEQALSQLRLQYARQLPQRALEIEECWRRAQSGGEGALAEP